MIVLEDLLRDRGSRYAAAAGDVANRAEIDAFLAALRRRRKFDKATHHSWAALLADGGPLKNDDGEAGAGAVILKMLEREGVANREATTAAVEKMLEFHMAKGRIVSESKGGVEYLVVVK